MHAYTHNSLHLLTICTYSALGSLFVLSLFRIPARMYALVIVAPVTFVTLEYNIRF
ncbi:hypothetical protein B0H19DRAFT_1133375 [Mycena capillaripes]|nr:hypothetical protein B0H19DRAFT_1133375 [Mycena capillaripes]